MKYSQWAQGAYAWKQAKSAYALHETSVEVELLARNGYRSEQVTTLLKRHQSIYGRKLRVSA